MVTSESALSQQHPYNFRGLRVRDFLKFLDPSDSPNLVALHAVSSAEGFSALLPTNCDFLCSSPQCPIYHFHKLLIPSSDFLYFPLLFLRHIHHHVPCAAFTSHFKNLVLSLPPSSISCSWSWFGLQVHRSGETSSVPVQHWAELLQEGLPHDCGGLDAGVRSVMPSPLWLQYYRWVMS